METLQNLKKKKDLPQDPAIPLLGINAKKEREREKNQ